MASSLETIRTRITVDIPKRRITKTTEEVLMRWIQDAQHDGYDEEYFFQELFNKHFSKYQEQYLNAAKEFWASADERANLYTAFYMKFGKGVQKLHKDPTIVQSANRILHNVIVAHYIIAPSKSMADKDVIYGYPAWEKDNHVLYKAMNDFVIHCLQSHAQRVWSSLPKKLKTAVEKATLDE